MTILNHIIPYDTFVLPNTVEMPLRRNKSQKSNTLVEYYTELKNESNVVSKGMGTLMLNWIDRINLEFKETEIWGLTSHDHLVLQSENNFSSPIYIVLTTGMDEYHIEYLIPKESEPWKNAYVKGATKSLDKAMEMLKTAIINSKGWSNPKESK